MQKLHNIYQRNSNGYYSNYIHSKNATQMFMAYGLILPLVSFRQHSIYIEVTISELGDLETTVVPQQMAICQNCANRISPSAIQPPSQRPNFEPIIHKIQSISYNSQNKIKYTCSHKNMIVNMPLACLWPMCRCYHL